MRIRGRSRIGTQPVSSTNSYAGMDHQFFLPLVLFMDLIQHYDRLLPPTLTKKKRESERKIPQRKRTAMVDMRMRRSNISDVTDLKEAIVQQNTRRTGPGSRSSISTTTGPPESVKVLTPGQDSRPEVPPALRAGRRSSNTSPIPPPRPIISGSPTPVSLVPPPPPFEGQKGSTPPPLPPGFVPPPPPPPLVAGSQGNSPSFPEPQISGSDNKPDSESYVSPSMPSFKDPSDGYSPTTSSNPPSRSSSPAIGGNNRGGAPLRGTVRGLALRGSGRGPRPGVPSAPRRGAYVQSEGRPRTPPHSPGKPYNPSAHRRSGSGSGFARRTMASDAEVN